MLRRAREQADADRHVEGEGPQAVVPAPGEAARRQEQRRDLLEERQREPQTEGRVVALGAQKSEELVFCSRACASDPTAAASRAAGLARRFAPRSGPADWDDPLHFAPFPPLDAAPALAAARKRKKKKKKKPKQA